MKIINKIKLNFDLTAETGLHIGGNKGNMEIGGVDNPVLRNPVDHYPYIPGSSLKGKIRAMLEFKKGLAVDPRHECSDSECIICSNFGSAKGELKQTASFIFRDAFITEDWKEKLKTMDTDLLYTENKKENTIDRIKCEAHPRDLERVPAGTKFDVEIVITNYEGKDLKKQMEVLKEGINLLELDYLGGSGTRGSGKVSFKFKNATDINGKEYTEAKSIFE